MVRRFSSLPLGLPTAIIVAVVFITTGNNQYFGIVTDAFSPAAGSSIATRAAVSVSQHGRRCPHQQALPAASFPMEPPLLRTPSSSSPLFTSNVETRRHRLLRPTSTWKKIGDALKPSRVISLFRRRRVSRARAATLALAMSAAGFFAPSSSWNVANAAVAAVAKNTPTSTTTSLHVHNKDDIDGALSSIRPMIGVDTRFKAVGVVAGIGSAAVLSERYQTHKKKKSSSTQRGMSSGSGEGEGEARFNEIMGTRAASTAARATTEAKKEGGEAKTLETLIERTKAREATKIAETDEFLWSHRRTVGEKDDAAASVTKVEAKRLDDGAKAKAPEAAKTKDAVTPVAAAPKIMTKQEKKMTSPTDEKTEVLEKVLSETIELCREEADALYEAQVALKKAEDRAKDAVAEEDVILAAAGAQVNADQKALRKAKEEVRAATAEKDAAEKRARDAQRAMDKAVAQTQEEARRRASAEAALRSEEDDYRKQADRAKKQEKELAETKLKLQREHEAKLAWKKEALQEMRELRQLEEDRKKATDAKDAAEAIMKKEEQLMLDAEHWAHREEEARKNAEVEENLILAGTEALMEADQKALHRAERNLHDAYNARDVAEEKAKVAERVMKEALQSANTEKRTRVTAEARAQAAEDDYRRLQKAMKDEKDRREKAEAKLRREHDAKLAWKHEAEQEMNELHEAQQFIMREEEELANAGNDLDVILAGTDAFLEADYKALRKAEQELKEANDAKDAIEAKLERTEKMLEEAVQISEHEMRSCATSQARAQAAESDYRMLQAEIKAAKSEIRRDEEALHKAKDEMKRLSNEVVAVQSGNVQKELETLGELSADLKMALDESAKAASARKSKQGHSSKKPKSPKEEQTLAAKYAAMTEEERAFHVLHDLGMIETTPDPADPNFDHSHDDEYCAENVLELHEFERMHFE